MAKSSKQAAPARGKPKVAPADVQAASQASPAQVAAREVAAVWVPIGELKAWAKNPRRADTQPVDEVAKSIERWGFAAPIIARRADGEVIAGHTRLKAAAKLGLEMVPVRFLDLDPAEAHLLALADNKIAEKAEWDTPLLAEAFDGLGLDDLAVAGFDQAALDEVADELARGASSPEPGGSTDPDAEWEGMPEFDQKDKTAFRTLQVHFKDQAAVDLFARTVGHNITDRTRYLWFPEIEIERLVDKRYDGGRPDPEAGPADPGEGDDGDEGPDPTDP